MGYIYKITNKVNNKVYIGQTSKTLKERFAVHLRHARNRVNRYLYDAMNHYGYENFVIEPIERCDKALLDEREIYWISVYQSADPEFGYNMTVGGGGGDTFTNRPEEAKQSFREAVSARQTGKKRPKEFGEKVSAKLKGRTLSEEQRKKLSEAQKARFKDTPGTRLGSTVSELTKQKIREANLGKKQSEETKLKRKETLSKLKWWNNGIENVRAEKCPDGYSAGRIKFNPSEESRVKSSHKGTRWFTNGKENRMAYECPKGFWPGKTLKKDLIK